MELCIAYTSAFCSGLCEREDVQSAYTEDNDGSEDEVIIRALVSPMGEITHQIDFPGSKVAGKI